MKTLILVSGLLLSGVASADPCVPRHVINGFSTAGRNAISVGSGRNTYILTTRSCHELAWADGIGFRTWPSGAAQVCKGDSLLTLDMSGRITDTCPIISIHRK